MARVAAADPSDVESRIFWALAIAQAAKPTDKTFSNQLKAAAILEPLFKQMPQHPGIAHYIIHSYDVPPLAAKALPAARAYADIAPSAPHALHMPSHTFTRVGLWKESVVTNTRSAQVAEQAGEFGDALHALDYMTYAYLQMGMDADAEQAARRASALAAKQADVGGVPNAFAIAAVPARLALERQDWAAAARLEVKPSPATPYAEAMTHFARAVAMARSGNPGATKPEVARLEALRDREIELKDPYWAEIVDIQRRGAEAWALFAAGKRDEGIRLMRAAADAEDATEKAAVTPGPLAPAREMLGVMLLESGKSADALAAFEVAIVHEPNRFQSLYGAAQAAEKLRQSDKAKKYYRQIADICSAAPPNGRASLEHARKQAGP
jgi:tetratricopeptide (TPR) repeat protein